MTTPNMGLLQPTTGPGGTQGPSWATQLNSDLTLIDAHDHTPGKGVVISAATGGLSVFSVTAYGVDVTGDITKAVSNSAGLDACTAAAAAVNGIVFFPPGTCYISRTWNIKDQYVTIMGSGGAAQYGGSTNTSFGPLGYFIGAASILSVLQDNTANNPGFPLISLTTNKRWTGVQPPNGMVIKNIALRGSNFGSPNRQGNVQWTINVNGITNAANVTTVNTSLPSVVGYVLVNGEFVYISTALGHTSPYNGLRGPITVVSATQFTFAQTTGGGLPVDGGVGVVTLGPKLVKDANGNPNSLFPYCATIQAVAAPGITNNGVTTTVNVDQTNNNGIYTGATIDIIGATNPIYNGHFGPIAVTTAQQFTFAQALATHPNSGGGFVGLTGNQHGIVVNNFQANLEHVTIADTLGHGLFIQDCLEGTFNDVTVANAAGSAVFMDGRPYPTAVTFSNATAAAVGIPGETNNGTVTTITTLTNHNLTSGMNVQISGAGVAGYNGQFGPITVSSPTIFSYAQTAALANDGGATVSSPMSPNPGPTIAAVGIPGCSNSGTTTIVKTTVAHGLFDGACVIITGAGVGSYNTAANTVSGPITVVDSKTFSFAQIGPFANSGGGIVNPDFVSGLLSHSPQNNVFTGLGFSKVGGTAINLVSDCTDNTFHGVNGAGASGYGVDIAGGNNLTTRNCVENHFYGFHEEVGGAWGRFQDQFGGVTAGTGSRGNVIIPNSMNDIDPTGFGNMLARIGGIQNVIIGAVSTNQNNDAVYQNLGRFGGLAMTRVPSTANGAYTIFPYQAAGIAEITLNAASTFTFIGGEDGQIIHLILIQGAGGNKTVTWPANVVFRSGILPTLSSTAGVHDYFNFYFNATDQIYYEIGYGSTNSLIGGVKSQYFEKNSGQPWIKENTTAGGGGGGGTIIGTVNTKNDGDLILAAWDNLTSVFEVSRNGLVALIKNGGIAGGLSLRAGTGFYVDGTDSTGTPGNVTINKIAGKAAVAAAGTTCVVTNNLVTATSTVVISPISIDATAVKWGVVAGAGSFTVTVAAAATAAWSFGFFVMNPAL